MDTFASGTPEYAREVELAPRKVRGWVHEVEVPMRKGDMLHYASDHDARRGPVEFNVHSHKGKETTYHVKGAEASQGGAFVAPWEGKFYLMWENTADVAVRVRITARRHEVFAESVEDPADHAHD